MKKIISILTFFSLILLLSSCAAIGAIFKAGVWVGVLVVIGIILLIVFLFSRGSKNK